MKHRDLTAAATASVWQARSIAAKDPRRPVYHSIAPAYWMSDPNGPIYYNGYYHLFYQHNPYGAEWGNMSWGHARSRDLVHWEYLPVALTPEPGTYDKDGVFSGCCVINNGLPTILYTGVWPEVQCLAHSRDGMLSWEKNSGNPVIDAPPRNDLSAFRDPFIWREADIWNMVIGSGIRSEEGTVLLYQSDDLLNWKYIHRFCDGPGKISECPNFQRFENGDLVIVSPENVVQYSIGKYHNNSFYPGVWKVLNLGTDKDFYAPNTMCTPNGRVLMWGWIQVKGSEGYPWNGALSLPRELNIDKDGYLLQSPARELEILRGPERELHADGNAILLPGNNWEIEINTVLDNSQNLVFELSESIGEDSLVKIEFNHQMGQVTVNGDSAGLNSKDILLRLFWDWSIWELFINDRICATGRSAGTPAKDKVLIINNPLSIKSVRYWHLILD